MKILYIQVMQQNMSYSLCNNASHTKAVNYIYFM